MNITMPYNLLFRFYEVQDKILRNELQKKRIVDADALQPLRDSFILIPHFISVLIMSFTPLQGFRSEGI